jgi:hypothetical protein
MFLSYRTAEAHLILASLCPKGLADSGGEGEKAIAFRVAEGLRWTEWGVQAYYRMLQGTVALIFGVAIAKVK